MSLKPLGKLKELIEAAGMAISYAYDDLVFLDHNVFLLQFCENGGTVFIHTNSEADSGEISEGVARLKKISSAAGHISMVEGVFYTLTQAGDNSISIEFHGHC